MKQSNPFFKSKYPKMDGKQLIKSLGLPKFLIIYMLLLLGYNSLIAQVNWNNSSQQFVTGTSASLIVTKPTGTVQGDLIIMHLHFKDRPGSITAPAGFTLITSAAGASAGNDAAVYAYYKIAGASEPANYTFSLTTGAGTTWRIQAARVTGHDSTTPIGPVANSHSGTTAVTSRTLSLTTNAPKSLLVGACTTFDTPGQLSGPEGLMFRYYANANPGYAAFTQTIAAQGATGNKILSWPTDRVAGAILYAIRPGSDINDSDGDGLNNTTDLDDDNDGILDINEIAITNYTSFNSTNSNAFNFSLPHSINGDFIMDIIAIDNSFNLTINGIPLVQSVNNGNEVQCCHVWPNCNFNGNILFQDGTRWGSGGIPEVWNITGNLATPVIRVIIYASGNVEFFGSKVSNGPLYPMTLNNGTIINPLILNLLTQNNFIIDQIKVGTTYISGVVYFTNNKVLDTDGDGIINTQDTDSDNDGVPDALEAKHDLNTALLDANGRILTNTGTTGLTNGVPNNAFGGTGFPPLDTDGDGKPDFLDIDSDNDGISDVIESQPTSGYSAPSGIDIDGDGIDNTFDINTNAANTLTKTITNTDGIDTPDMYDTDSDNDGLLDYLEAYDTNVNGFIDGAEKIPDTTDTDVDGLLGGFDLYALTTANALPNITSNNNTNGGQTAINPFPYRLENSEGLWRDAVCQIVGSTTGVATPSITAISLMTTHATGWPGAINNGYLVLESKTKGMVITRMPTAALPTGANAIQGMLVYDTTANCLKMYNGSLWGCITEACPE